MAVRFIFSVYRSKNGLDLLLCFWLNVLIIYVYDFYDLLQEMCTILVLGKMNSKNNIFFELVWVLFQNCGFVNIAKPVYLKLWMPIVNF